MEAWLSQLSRDCVAFERSIMGLRRAKNSEMAGHDARLLACNHHYGDTV